MNDDFATAREEEYARFIRSLPPIEQCRSAAKMSNRLFRRAQTVEQHMESWEREWRQMQAGKAVGA